MASSGKGNIVTGSIANLIGGVSQQPWNVRMPSQAEEQINCHSTITEFMRRRPALKHIGKVDVPDTDGNFTVVSIDKGVVGEQYLAIFGKSGITMYDLHGVKQNVEMTESGLAYLSQLQEAPRDLRFCTIKDYTFCVNRLVTVQEELGAYTPRNPEAVVFVKQASYQTTYRIILDGVTYSVTTSDGLYEEGTAPPELSANKILTDLLSAIQGGSEASKWDIRINNATMWIRRNDRSDFTWDASDSRSNTHIEAFRAIADNVSDLPTIAPEGMTLRIKGDSTTVKDDYYVVFVPDGKDVDSVNMSSEEMKKGAWMETVAPGKAASLKPLTMPHALVLKEDGTGFIFKSLEWGKRRCGDDDTNPSPSFIDRTINNILFYRNRMTFLSGDNVIMSEANEFFNFYLTTVTTAIDSDPIDVAASGVKGTILYGYAVYNGGLILFSTKGQFHLEHDTVLANSTVSLSPVTEFESSDRVMPQSSGKTIFFTTDRGKWIGVREYISFDSDNMESNDASDVSAHVPRYIPGKVDDLQCSTNEDVLLVRSTSEKDALWVYKYFWDGNNKAQSSWYKWKMSGVIHSNLFFNTDVYCIMQYDGVFSLETFSFEPAHKDDGEDFEFCLDRKLDDSKMTIGEYDPLTKTTKVTVPYVDDRVVLVTRSGGDLKAGSVLDIEEREEDETHGTTILTVKAKLTQGSTKLFAGVPYESTYQFTTLGIRNQNNTAITTGRLQLRSLSINLYRTGYVLITVKPKGRLPFNTVFTGKRLGEDSSTIGEIPIYTGQIKAPILSRNDAVDIVVSSSSHLPFSLVNADWEGFYSARSSRV